MFSAAVLGFACTIVSNLVPISPTLVSNLVCLYFLLASSLCIAKVYDRCDSLLNARFSSKFARDPTFTSFDIMFSFASFFVFIVETNDFTVEDLALGVTFLLLEFWSLSLSFVLEFF